MAYLHDANVRNMKTGATKWIIRCKRSLFEGPGRAEGVLWASVMNADGAFARYNLTGCENGRGLGSQWPIRMRQGGRERDGKGPFLSPP